MAVRFVPDGFHTVTPYLHTQGVPQLVDFLRHAFAAAELHRTTLPDGAIANARIKIGDSIIELSEVRGQRKPMPVALHLYVEDADTIYHRAIEAGASSLYEPEQMPYGDREAGVEDHWGNHWYIGTHVKDDGSQ